MHGRTHPQEIIPTGYHRDSAGRLRRGDGSVGGGWCPPDAPLPRANLAPFSGVVGLREAVGIAVKSLVRHRNTRKRTMTRSVGFGKGGGKLDRRQARGVQYSCARESKARTGGFAEGKVDL